MSTKNSNIFKSFADSVTDFPETALIPDRLFLIFAVCAFFRGAEQHICQRSKLDEQESLSYLLAELTRLCKLNQEMALDAVNSVEPYANKYFVIEYIVDQGREAADKWLSCDDEGAENPLQALVQKYQELTLADLGIEGVNREYQLQQKQLFSEIDRSVGKLRRRNMLSLLLVAVVVFAGLRVLHII